MDFKKSPKCTDQSEESIHPLKTWRLFFVGLWLDERSSRLWKNIWAFVVSARSKQAEAAFFLLETSVDVGDVSLRLTRSCCFTLSHWQHQWVLSFNKGFGWDQPLTCGASYTCVGVSPFLKAAFMLCSVLLKVSTIPVSPVPTWILDQCYWFKNRFAVKRSSDMDLNQRMFSCPSFLP